MDICHQVTNKHGDLHCGSRGAMLFQLENILYILWNGRKNTWYLYVFVEKHLFSVLLSFHSGVSTEGDHFWAPGDVDLGGLRDRSISESTIGTIGTGYRPWVLPR